MPYDQSTKTLTLKRISATFVLHRDPVIAGQLRDDPIAVESPDTTVFLAAKQVVRIIIDLDVVDVSHAGFDLLSETQAPTFILGEHRRRQAELGLVGQLQRMCLVTRSDDRRYRTKLLSLGQVTHVIDIDEHMRRQYLPVCSATEQQLDAFGFRRLDPGHCALQLATVDQRANDCICKVRIADFQLANALDKRFDEILLQRGVDDNPVTAHADLTLVQEAPHNGGVHRQIEVRVIKHHTRSIPTQLQPDSLERRACDCQRAQCAARPESIP